MVTDPPAEGGSILWRRLDIAGHDACVLERRGSGWRLEGAAVFRHDGAAACLNYRVDADERWQTRGGAVLGWLGTRPVSLQVARAPDGVWTLNGHVIPAVAGCVDLDLGFTPATNLFQLRRVALQIGGGEDVPAAWLDVDTGTLDALPQRYERRAEESYWYAAPRFKYAALLEVNRMGFVERYPGLWEAEK